MRELDAFGAGGRFRTYEEYIAFTDKITDEMLAPLIRNVQRGQLQAKAHRDLEDSLVALATLDPYKAGSIVAALLMRRVRDALQDNRIRNDWTGDSDSLSHKEE